MRLIANALLNFFKCLVYVFVPLGCIFLGALFGLSGLFGAFFEQADYIAREIGALLPDAEAHADELFGFLVASVRSLDWSDPLAAVNTVLTTDWLSGMLAEFFQLSETAAAELSQRLAGTLENVVSALGGALSAFAALLVLGVVLGYFVTNYFVRKSTVRRGFWKFWLNSIVDSLLTATIVAFTLWLLAVWDPGALISAVVGILLFGFVALFEAYLLHGRGKVAFRSVVTVENCFLLFVSQLAIFAVALGIVWLIGVLANAVVALGIGIAVAIIAFLVVNVNAESYVYRVANGLGEGRKALPAPTFEESKREDPSK